MWERPTQALTVGEAGRLGCGEGAAALHHSDASQESSPQRGVASEQAWQAGSPEPRAPHPTPTHSCGG